jgi:hypothetical protein
MATAEASTVFSLEEKARVRYHLGYLNIQPVLSIQLGVPAVSQTGFLVEAALDRVPVSQAGFVRRLLSTLDMTEARMIEAQERLAATRLGEITLNPDEIEKLEIEHTRWARRLGDFLGCPINPYSSDPASAGKRPLSGPVIH